MSHADRRSWALILALVSAGEGVLLATGLETCFGVGQYTRIMLFGTMGGFGIGLLVWLARTAFQRGTRLSAAARMFVLASLLPGLVIFLIACLWRILPLIREELKYTL